MKIYQHKKGQFFLLSAIIIILVVVAIFLILLRPGAVSTSSLVTTSPNFYFQSIKSEAARPVVYALVLAAGNSSTSAVNPTTALDANLSRFEHSIKELLFN